MRTPTLNLSLSIKGIPHIVGYFMNWFLGGWGAAYMVFDRAIFPSPSLGRESADDLATLLTFLEISKLILRMSHP